MLEKLLLDDLIAMLEETLPHALSLLSTICGYHVLAGCSFLCKGMDQGKAEVYGVAFFITGRCYQDYQS